jgi:hypothetical protein
LIQAMTVSLVPMSGPGIYFARLRMAAAKVRTGRSCSYQRSSMRKTSGALSGGTDREGSYGGTTNCSDQIRSSTPC